MGKRFKCTLDIDTADKGFIEHITNKILNCKFCLDIIVTYSSLKGVHIIIYCNKKCEICRFVYDDFRRFAYDQNRPYYARNILFQEKEVVRLKKNAL